MAHMDSSTITVKTADGRLTPDKDDMLDPGGDEMKKSSSRFKVARVEFVEKKDDNENEDGDWSKTDEVNHGNRSPESPSVTFSLGTDSLTHSYDTGNMKTFAMNTHEALPCMDHYRNILSATGVLKSRPTLAELHEEMAIEMDEAGGDARGRHKEPLIGSEEKIIGDGQPVVTTEKITGSTKFGWIKGVLIRCLLNIWGVMLFIRLSWCVGQAGMVCTSLIILLSGVVTTLTALSMSAICTNGSIKGGGAYFMISRSLGPEFGGAIGLIFSVANAVAVAMYVVGFAETVRDLLKAHDALMVDEVNDIRIVGVITIVILLCIAIIGMEWEARAQLILLGVLIIALVASAVGSFLPPPEEKVVKGYIGYNVQLFKENLLPDYREGESFFSVFAVFFPAATGILAGANISGDLKDASASIPKGTLSAILLSTIIYLIVAWMLGASVARDATGYLPAIVVSNITSTIVNGTTVMNSTDIIIPRHYNLDVIRNCSQTASGVCDKYGLLHDYQVMEMMSAFGPLVTAGIFSATLSSALASLVSAPKVFQAVCKDKIFPKIHIFAKGYGNDDSPRLAYLLAFAIGFAFVCIGDLNAIAPVISNFFLMSYALINYSCFDASLARSPGWRPAFRFYSMWISLLGAIICLAVMFIINWWTALITFGVICALFVYVHYRKPDVNWGSSTQAHVYRGALQSALKLISVEDHIKNFRPQVLVLSGVPENRPALVDFVSHITKKISLMVCGNIVVGDQKHNLKVVLSEEAYAWLNKRHIKSFYRTATAPSFRLGAQSLMQLCGIGKLRPNLLMMGFKSNWSSCSGKEVFEYFNVIHDAFDLRFGVGILRLKEGFGLDVDHEADFEPDTLDPTEDDVSEDDITPEDTPPLIQETKATSNINGGEHKNANNGGAPILKPDLQINKEVLKAMNKFHRGKKKGTIDVWWLFDDGGLTLLIPYILTTKSHWGNCRLRVFTVSKKKGEIDREQQQMATLLSKFRIECKDMNVINVSKPPKEESVRDFNSRLSDWMLDESKGETSENCPWKTSASELETLKDKTNRHIRLRELMIENSRDASLIVMTLPMPRKAGCSASMYMSWIDTLTRDMPPILLLRGNQTSVLTFYS
ncbi:hypothetical protein SNE40_011727 [Patella caerulea]|uniref:Uncharacterized protein n=1 Tax=Patella caerulea TaxID=87958 RepID=A0AAN8JK11_PATCE